MIIRQNQVEEWVRSTFGDASQEDSRERSMRFLEESLELCQAIDAMTKEDAEFLVQKVFSREPGKVHQEFGGMMVTACALAQNQGESLLHCLNDEEERIHRPEVIERCKQRQAEKNAEGY